MIALGRALLHTFCNVTPDSNQINYTHTAQAVCGRILIPSCLGRARIHFLPYVTYDIYNEITRLILIRPCLAIGM